MCASVGEKGLWIFLPPKLTIRAVRDGGAQDGHVDFHTQLLGSLETHWVHCYKHVHTLSVPRLCAGFPPPPPLLLLPPCPTASPNCGSYIRRKRKVICYAYLCLLLIFLFVWLGNFFVWLGNFLTILVGLRLWPTIGWFSLVCVCFDSFVFLSLSLSFSLKTGFWLNRNYNLCKIKFSSSSSLSQCLPFLARPDITVMIEWALKAKLMMMMGR